MLSLLTHNARLIFAVFGIIGAFFAPPWVPLVIMLILAIRYPAWEAILIGLLVDLLWLPATAFTALPLFTIAGLALVWGFEPLRREFLVGKGV